jgi:outer membrane protein TolC
LERKALNKLQSIQIQLQDVVRRETQGKVLQLVYLLYWEACGIDAELELRKEINRLYEKKSAGLQLLLDQGQISLAQSLPKQMKQIELSIVLDELTAQRDEAVEDLAALCGVEPAAILLEIPPELSEASFSLPFKTWKQLAPKSRTDLNKSALQVEEAQVARELVSADRMVWIDHLQTGYEVSNAPGDRDQASLQIALRLPFLVSDQGEKIRAVKNVQAYRAQNELKRQLVNREVEGLIKTFRSLHRRWQVQAASIHAIDKELASAISKMEKQGASLDAASLDAQIARVELKLKSLQLRADYQRLRLKADTILQLEDILPQSTD